MHYAITMGAQALNTHNKGMHSYGSHHEDMKGFAVICGPGMSSRITGQIYLMDICPTLRDLLGVCYPVSKDGVYFPEIA